MEISTPPEIAVETHFYMGHGNATISVFLPADGKASYLVLPTLVSLIPDGAVQSENAYFFHSLQRGKLPPPLLKLLTSYYELPKLGAQVALQYNVLITV